MNPNILPNGISPMKAGIVLVLKIILSRRKFKNRMEAKDKSFGFDFEGVYDEVIPHER
jgi:hypothetical protein